MNFIHEHVAVHDLEIDLDSVFRCFENLDDKFLSVSHRTQLTMKIKFESEEMQSKDEIYIKNLIKEKVHPLVYDFMKNIKLNKDDYSHFPNILSSKMIPGTDMGSHFDPEDSVIYLLYLNEGFDGGNLVFDDLGIEFTPKPGKLFMFYSKYKHHVTMLSGEPRYTISSGFAPKGYLAEHKPSE